MEENLNLRLVNTFRRSVHLSEHSFFMFKGQGRVLSMLRRSGGKLEQREIQARTELRSSSLSEITAKLESSGFVTKSVGEGDRRSTLLTLTEAGWKEALRINEESRKLGDKAFQALTEEEKSELLRLLGKLNSYWKEAL